MGFYGCIPRFIKNHAGWILTALGLGGMTSTVILTARAAPKVDDEIGSLQIEKWCDDIKAAGHWDDEDPNEYNPPLPELTFGEKFEIAAPHYLPAFLVGLASAGCFIGAQIISQRQNMALLAAYGVLASEFHEYRKDVRKEIGSEREQMIFEANHRKMMEMRKEIERLKKENGPQLYMIACLPNVIFESRPEHISNALMHFNRNLTMRGSADLVELYSFIGIPEDVWQNLQCDEYGWETYENEVSWGCIYTDFPIRQYTLKDGRVLNCICTDIPPYKLGLDYGSSDSSCDNLYHEWIPEFEQVACWLDTLDEKDILKFEAPDVYAPGVF